MTTRSDGWYRDPVHTYLYWRDGTHRASVYQETHTRNTWRWQAWGAAGQQIARGIAPTLAEAKLAAVVAAAGQEGRTQ